MMKVGDLVLRDNSSLVGSESLNLPGTDGGYGIIIENQTLVFARPTGRKCAFQTPTQYGTDLTTGLTQKAVMALAKSVLYYKIYWFDEDTYSWEATLTLKPVKQK